MSSVRVYVLLSLLYFFLLPSLPPSLISFMCFFLIHIVLFSPFARLFFFISLLLSSALSSLFSPFPAFIHVYPMSFLIYVVLSSLLH